MKNSRRSFLKTMGAVGLTTATPFAANLATLGSAAAQSSSGDYKALVCIFLFGGNDHNNTLVPFDTDSYNAYYNARSTIALPPTQLLQINPLNINDGRKFALHSKLAPLQSLFEQGKAAVLANVGSLIVPVTKVQVAARSAALPPKLFSHNDQQSFWQTTLPEGAKYGWGGRMGDILMSNNGAPIFSAVSASGTSTFLAGKRLIQYPISTNGAIAISGISGGLYGSPSAATTLKNILTQDRENYFEKDHSALVKRSIDAQSMMSSALSSTPSFDLPAEIANFGLAKQLRIIAKSIAAKDTLGMKRQVFFASIGSFDHHDNQLVNQANLFNQLAKSIEYFYNATVALGVADQVTTFTASDFGRTLASNGDGSDHGWGSHHFIIGGAVDGKKIHGTMPTVAFNTNEDIGSGRIIPSTSVDQYAATLGSWLGVGANDLKDILPNLNNFNNQNLGFLK